MRVLTACRISTTPSLTLAGGPLHQRRRILISDGPKASDNSILISTFILRSFRHVSWHLACFYDAVLPRLSIATSFRFGSSPLVFWVSTFDFSIHTRACDIRRINGIDRLRLKSIPTLRTDSHCRVHHSVAPCGHLD
jgi:hypothetical protein